MVWHEETDISDLDVVVIPGGFSYGDYLRCGDRFSPVCGALWNTLSREKFVLGICNGFQVLTEAGLLPGVLVRNRDLHFICDRVPVKVERSDLAWTQAYSPEQIITLAIAHGEGQYYVDFDILTQLEDNGQVLRHEGDTQRLFCNIAGICNRQGNVLGMMPHPERASDPMLRYRWHEVVPGIVGYSGLCEGSCIGAKILELIILEPVSLSLSDFFESFTCSPVIYRNSQVWQRSSALVVVTNGANSDGMGSNSSASRGNQLGGVVLSSASGTYQNWRMKNST